MKPALFSGRRLLLTGLAAAALVGGGGAVALAAAPGDDPAPTPTGVTADRILAAALAKAPGTAGGAELDDEDGRTVWQVDVLATDGTWHEVDLGTDGKVLADRIDRDDDDRDDAAELKAAGTTAAQAVAAALQAAPGTVVSVELDEDGRVWDVEVKGPDGTVRDLTVNTADGKVTANTVEEDD